MPCRCHADHRPAMLATGDGMLWLLSVANLSALAIHRNSNAAVFERTYQSNCVLDMTLILLDKT